MQHRYNASGKEIQWPEVFATNYLERPIQLENVSAYDFVKQYEIKYIGKTKKKKTGRSNEIFYFTDQHPGHKYAYVQKRTKEVVPMISSENGFPDLDSLQMDKGNVTFSVTDNRERYAKVALALIFPFWTLDDLKDSNTGMYWNKFIILQNAYQLSESGLQILQNIQDQIQCKKLKRFQNMLLSEVQEPDDEYSLEIPNILDDEDYNEFGRSAN